MDQCEVKQYIHPYMLRASGRGPRCPAEWEKILVFLPITKTEMRYTHTHTHIDEKEPLRIIRLYPSTPTFNSSRE